MAELITIGETMAVMAPISEGKIGKVGDFSLRIAGAESNTAIGITRLGHTAGWISALGSDPLGDYVYESILCEGVDVSQVLRDKSHRTGLMIKEFTEGKTAVYYYRENSAMANYSPSMLPLEYIKDAKVIHLTGITPVLSESCLNTVREVISLAKSNNILISFDPNVRKKIWGGKDYTPLLREIISNSDIVLLGLSEAREIYGISDAKEAINIILSEGASYVAVKDGDKGAYCANRSETVYVEPFLCNSIDPVGAGDGFNAGFLSGILEGRELAVCGRMGGIVGALATETTGDVDGYPTKEKMNDLLFGGRKNEAL